MLQILRLVHLLILFVLACSCGGDFPADVLDIHNSFREVHGVPPLTLDDELTKKADELAKLATKKGNLTKPQSGENTYMLCTSYNRAVTAKEAVEAWYDEVCNTGYSFAEPNNENAHAFTQSVWKDSSRLGIAKSVATNVGADGLKCTFVIALYRPPGNIELKGAKDRDELFRENIFKGSFNKTYCDKFKDAANKRQLLQIKDSYHAKQEVSQQYHHGDSEQLHHIVRRTLYYKIPAKFYIDSETGQTKIVSALGKSITYVKPHLLDDRSILGLPTDDPPPPMVPIFPASRGNPFNTNEENSVPPPDDFEDGDELKSEEVAQLRPSAPITTRAGNRGSIEIVDTGKKTREHPRKGGMVNIALNVHNKLRTIHGSPPLQLSADLSREAQQQAESNAALHTLSHASNLGMLGEGENLAYNCKNKDEGALIQESIKDWYSEVCKGPYDFASDDGHDALHFTQVVWKSTRLLGCGKAVTKRTVAGSPLTCTYFCCRYGPTGNVYGQFAKNVPKGNFGKQPTCDAINDVLNNTAVVAETVGATKKDLTSNNNDFTSKDQVAQQEEKLQSDGLQMHNLLRNIHGVRPLTLDKTLSQNARDWARYIASTDSLKHSKASDYGENIAYSCSGNKIVASVKDSINDWYDEVCTHDYNFQGDMQTDTLHFSQVLWNDSTALGIGMATSINNGMFCTYFVAQYKPKGNIIGRFSNNILKGGFNHGRYCTGVRNLIPEKDNLTQMVTGRFLQHEALLSNHNHSGIQQHVGDEGNVGGTSNLQDQDEKDYEFDAVKVLNRIRQIHESPPLSANKKLHMDAKDRAASFVTGSVKTVKNQSHVGEIVQVACNPLDRVLPPEEAIANWYSEVCVKGYNFDNDMPQNAFHFTQLIWKNSKDIGIAYSTKKKKNGNLCTVVIALFEPGGNAEHQFSQNIHRGTFDRSFCGSINSIAVSALDDEAFRAKG